MHEWNKTKNTNILTYYCLKWCWWHSPALQMNQVQSGVYYSLWWWQSLHILGYFVAPWVDPWKHISLSEWQQNTHSQEDTPNTGTVHKEGFPKTLGLQKHTSLKYNQLNKKQIQQLVLLMQQKKTQVHSKIINTASVLINLIKAERSSISPSERAPLRE